jgi:hypothetical protein
MIYVAASWPFAGRLKGPIGRCLETVRKAMSYSSTFDEDDA